MNPGQAAIQRKADEKKEIERQKDQQTPTGKRKVKDRPASSLRKEAFGNLSTDLWTAASAFEKKHSLSPGSLFRWSLMGRSKESRDARLISSQAPVLRSGDQLFYLPTIEPFTDAIRNFAIRPESSDRDNTKKDLPHPNKL
jgi:hypothetical protein